MPVNRNGRRAALVVSIVLALVATLGPVAGAATPEERRLQATRAKIAQVQAQIADASASAQADAAALADADRHLAVVMEAVGEAEQAVQRQQLAVEQARQELVELQAEAADQRQVMSSRAVSLYKRGTGAPMGAILESDSAEEALDRSSLVDAVTRSDRRSFEVVGIAQTAVAAQQEELEAEEQVLARVLDQQRVILAEAEEVRSTRAVAAAASRQQVDQLRAEESHLEAESREIAAIARRSSQQAASRAAADRSSQAAATSGGGAAPAAEVAPSGGGWVFPANGPVTSGYGRRWGRMHQGIDIGAPTGAPIYAARSGVVSYAARMSGYGNMVLIDHGGGIVTAYAHQSRIGVRVGQRVSAGQVIGAIGCTGNCTGPHLHFEVRVNGAARNPRSYI